MGSQKVTDQPQGALLAEGVVSAKACWGADVVGWRILVGTRVSLDVADLRGRCRP